MPLKRFRGGIVTIALLAEDIHFRASVESVVEGIRELLAVNRIRPLEYDGKLGSDGLGATTSARGDRPEYGGLLWKQQNHVSQSRSGPKRFDDMQELQHRLVVIC